MQLSLAGRNALVTGANGGLGRHFAQTLARAGANVAICARRLESLNEVRDAIRGLGARVECVALDVTDGASVAAAFAAAAAALGAITVVVNNAGIAVTKPILDQTEDDWREVIGVNLDGAWRVAQAAARHMVKHAQGGSIVNTSSGTVFKLVETRAHYVASKAAIVGLSRVLAKELGRHWIRVNTVAPGAVLSEEDPDEATIRNRERASPTRALQLIQYPEDIVGTVVFLLSDDSAFVTGQVIVVDGGNVAH